MNNQFLRQIFSKKEFAVEYKKFLGTFSFNVDEVHELIEEDNNSKIAYLSNMIESYLLSDQIQKIEGIKRLPWTHSILKKTETLAFNMI